MNERTIARCINIAKSLAPNNLSHRCSHVAFLVRGSRIAHIGINSDKTHPKTLDYNYDHYNESLCRVHAEFRVILRSSVKEKTEDLSHYELINVRIDRKGNINNGKPCRGCQHIISQMGIRRFYYTTAAGTVESEKI